MKKKTLATILALSVVLSFGACGQKVDSSKSDTEKTESLESTKKADSESTDTKTDDKISEESEKKTETTDAATQQTQETQDTQQQKTEVQVFVESDLEYAMNQVSKTYESSHPDVAITYKVDRSANLLAQIQGGTSCDLYFTDTESQMESLQSNGFIISNGYTNVVGNKLLVIAKKGSGTAVTSLDDIAGAGSIALAREIFPGSLY